MGKSFRIYIEIEKGISPFNRWTFDHPKTLSIGFTPDSDLWLLDGSAEAKREIFFRHGKELRLRVLPSLQGTLQVEKKELSFQTLREAGLFKTDRKGEYLPIQNQTTGRLVLGASLLRFWVKPEPEEPEFPLHPVWLRLLKSIPVLSCLCFIAGFVINLSFVRFISSLPPSPQLTIHEVSRKVARISIPKKNYVEKKYGALGKPRKLKPKLKKEKKQSKEAGISRSAIKGFLAAAVQKGSGKAGKTNSPFAALFTTESLAADLGGQLGEGAMDKMLSESLRSLERTGPSTETGSSTLGIGSIREGGLETEALGRRASRPVVSRLTATLPRGGSRVNRVALEEAVASRQGELRTCYEQALDRNPNLSGKVVIELRIAPNGSAQDVGVAQSSITDRGFHRCLIRQIGTWTFPATGNLTDLVRLPFVFSSASRG